MDRVGVAVFAGGRGGTRHPQRSQGAIQVTGAKQAIGVAYQLATGGTGQGPSSWVAGSQWACGNGSLICMGKTKTAALTFTTGNGLRAWLSNNVFVVGGSLSPDQQCQAEKPAGVVNARALIATTTHTAASVLDLQATYLRPDGIIVGTGAVLAARGPLSSGIWQAGNLTYPPAQANFLTWTGVNDLVSLGTLAGTCGNWTDPTQPAVGLGFPEYFSTFDWWAAPGVTQGCDGTQYGQGLLYCVEVR